MIITTIISKVMIKGARPWAGHLSSTHGRPKGVRPGAAHAIITTKIA